MLIEEKVANADELRSVWCVFAEVPAGLHLDVPHSGRRIVVDALPLWGNGLA